MDDPIFLRYRNVILDSLLHNQQGNLEVICSNGSVMVQGIVFASLLPSLSSLGDVSLEDCCILLPDVTTDQLTLFLQCLYNAKLIEFNIKSRKIIKEIADILGCKNLNFAKESPTVTFDVTNNVEETSGIIDHENSIVTTTEEKNCRKSILCLTQIDVDEVTDDILSDNFSDQDGRLVCLVCYKLLGSTEHKKFRSHMKQHDKTELEKVKIEVPLVGKGGPGLKKKCLTDADLENLYKDPSGTELVCNKCDKHSSISDKVNFRKQVL